VRALEQLPNVEVIRKPQGNNHVNMLWRFEATVDPDVEIVCIRDTDSRVGQRESAAVKEWLASPYDVHIMRDCGGGQHKFEIPGGMWGLRTRLLDRLGIRKGWSQLLTEKQAPQQRQRNNWFCQDQNMLKDWFYPKVLNHIVAHDEFYDFQTGQQKRPFPIQLNDAEHQRQFVGRIDFEVHCIEEMKRRLFPNDWPKDWTHLARYRATQDSVS